VRKVLVPAVLLLLAAAAAADIDDVHPVRAVLRADPGLLRLTLEANVESWGYGAGCVPGGPLSDEECRRRTADYLKTHLLLSADGRPLEPRVLGGRVVRELWRGEQASLVVLRAAYDPPPSLKVFSMEDRIYREEWDRVEGRGIPIPSDVTRDFRLFVEWAPGGTAILTPQASRRDVPWKALRRSVLRRWGESAAAGLGAFFSAVGAPALLISLLLFFPSRALASAGAGIALALAGAGSFLSWTPDAAERILWAGVVLAGAAPSVRRREIPWLAAVWIGAPAAGRLWVLYGRTYRDATGFAGFSWAAFAAGISALFAAAVLLRWPAVLLYERYFHHLTADERARQGVFHRVVVARLLALAGLYWIFSPLWARR
jgi:hypothetical protein